MAQAISDLEKWDDTALIDAFNRAMTAYPSGFRGGEPVEAVSDDEEDTQTADARFDALLQKSGDPPQPPPLPPLHPPSGDDGLSDLLMSWYYAGYYTGRFRALQEVRQQQQKPPPPQR
ncbi:hypothetical protein CTAYLR_000664 [Chrysophaeum taylorii]|uniref:Survival Motor Neuron Gemin2-binding domain-containing protein n=1 Tax=Chrysophaeum taylorii TaxID=2483200 RepID=A0AAD7XGC5_9STRA|nr:hypothetical protein CTAYLR_000664 [Chrysophaeum taylorii]